MVSLTSSGGASLALVSHISSDGVTKIIPYIRYMFYYIKQHFTPSFPSELVKTESESLD